MEPCLQCIKEEVNDDDVILDEKDPLQDVLLNSILPTEVSPNFELLLVKNEIKTEEYSDDDTPNDDELEKPDDNVRLEAEIVKTEVEKVPTQQSTSVFPQACTKNEIEFSDKSNKQKFCQICSEWLPKTYMEHYRETHNGYSYKCTVCCEKLFKLRKEFERHVNKAKGIEPYQCNKCSENFLSSMDLQTHYNKKHPEAGTEEIEFSNKSKKYGRQKCCQICSEKLPRVHMEHYRETHNGYSYKCAVCCEQLFKTRKEFERHVNKTKGVKPYQCSKCPSKFISSIDFQIHTHKKHSKAFTEEKIRQCKYCPKIFKKKANWQQHVYHHTSSYSKNCKICGQVFTRAAHYYLHKLSHMERQKCLECSKTFANKYILETHVRTIHRGERSDGGEILVCQICAKTVTSLQSLKYHLKTHAKKVKKMAEDGISRPFQCDMCERRFIHKFHLNEHKKLQHFKINVLSRNNESKKPQTTFPCPICKKEFVRRNNLNQHSAMHSDENKYKCNICFATFRFKNSLSRHMQNKTSHVTNTCTTCGDKFVGKKNFSAHLLVHMK